MRHAIIYAVSSFLLAITVTAIPETPFSPYLGPLLHQLFGINSIYDISNEQNSSATNVERELRRRQGIDIDIDEDLCPDDFNPCVALGAPGLCCEENQNCALDNAGRVACCPEGAVCTGIIDLPAPTDAANTITDFVLASTAGGGVVINVGTATEGFVVETELAESAAEARLMPPAIPLLRVANKLPQAMFRLCITFAALTMGVVVMTTIVGQRWPVRRIATS